MIFKDKSAKEQGIDLTRKFVVVESSSISNGDILELVEDDNSNKPFFKSLTTDNSFHYFWKKLAYVEENIDNLEVGDIILSKDGFTREIMGVCDEKVFIASENNFGLGLCMLKTKQELKRCGWKLKDVVGN